MSDDNVLGTRAAPRPARTPLQVQRDVIYALLIREVSSKFGKSRASFLWVLFEPVAHLVFPLAMFGFAFERTLPGIDYPVFLVYGFLPFLLFKTICLQTMEGARVNRGLMSYRQVLLMDVFVANALASCSVEAMVFAVVLTGVAMLGFDVLPSWPMELGGVLALTVLFAFGLGLLFGALTSVVPDAKSVVRVLFIPLYFLSGILFPISRFPEEWVQWLAINPVLHLVEMSRGAAVAHYVPMRLMSLEYVAAVTVVSLFIGLALYRLRVLSRVTT
ncbi:MAG TPA: ABC transporter permease [Vicinamibacterales bacterium]|nr:ABC transporter permease [Vicinamibacterales bacterium]